ncbi:MAG: hypothetical protein ACLT98_16605 [Eggerthellaceae bacterium]
MDELAARGIGRGERPRAHRRGSLPVRLLVGQNAIPMPPWARCCEGGVRARAAEPLAEGNVGAGCGASVSSAASAMVPGSESADCAQRAHGAPSWQERARQRAQRGRCLIAGCRDGEGRVMILGCSASPRSRRPRMRSRKPTAAVVRQHHHRRRADERASDEGAGDEGFRPSTTPTRAPSSPCTLPATATPCSRSHPAGGPTTIRSPSCHRGHAGAVVCGRQAEGAYGLPPPATSSPVR